MKKWLRWIGYLVVGLPLFALAQCLYLDSSQQRGLQSWCASLKSGDQVQTVLDPVASGAFTVRTGGVQGKDEGEWFDREYLRIHARLQKDVATPLDVTVVFAKPAMGYYSCIISYTQDAVITAWFEDHSS